MCVNDLLNQNGSFLDLNTFNSTYRMQVHFLEYNGILAAIKAWMTKKKLLLQNYAVPIYPEVPII